MFLEVVAHAVDYQSGTGVGAADETRDCASRPHQGAGPLECGRWLSQREVAEFLGVGLRSVNRWVNRFRGEGGTALLVRPGRGRRPRVQLEELQRYVRQSPRGYGLPQTRWTLRALAQTVPSLQ